MLVVAPAPYSKQRQRLLAIVHPQQQRAVPEHNGSGEAAPTHQQYPSVAADPPVGRPPVQLGWLQASMQPACRRGTLEWEVQVPGS